MKNDHKLTPTKQALQKELSRLKTLADAFDATVEKFGKENLVLALCGVRAADGVRKD